MRAFWPPDTLIPFSPIWVMSPPGSMLRSDASAHASTTRWYHFSSMAPPNRMLARTVSDAMKGVCAAYATVPSMEKSASSCATISPSRAASTDDLPEPTLPAIIVSDPAASDSWMSTSVGLTLRSAAAGGCSTGSESSGEALTPPSSGTEAVPVRFIRGTNRPALSLRAPPRPPTERVERVLRSSVGAGAPFPRPPADLPVPLPPPLPLRGGGTSGGIHAKLPRSETAERPLLVPLPASPSAASAPAPSATGINASSPAAPFRSAGCCRDWAISLFLRKRLTRAREMRRLSDWMMMKGRKTSGKRS
mmetsp:Transcript_10743/g.35641  ORF Transcript_10743/g.35641 Transcript_10743/m.35641 type:complete len:306 (-) Transcript_10743:725-1642(-)